ncbi:MAG: 2-oxo acid dehydrogenase subunit E2, partial [Candidatus Methanomethylicia archaeon]
MKGQESLKEREYEIVSLSLLRREIAKRIDQGYKIPTARLITKVCANSILSMKEKLEKAYGKDISLTAIIISKVAKTLLHHTKLNSVYINNEWRIYNKRVNISLAIQTKNGLIAPVIRDAHIKSIVQISDEIKLLQKRGDEGSLRIEDVTGGTFTITNLGPYDVLMFDAIINPPQIAILAIGSIFIEQKIINGKLIPEKYMYISLGFDHRFIDGYDAALFL